VNQRPFEALVVDFGGVLTTPLREAMRRFCEDSGIELQDLARAALGVYFGGEDDLVVAFETGRMSEEDFSHAFARRLREFTGVEIAHEGLVGRMFADMELEAPMLTAVEVARRAGLKTGLLSNSWGAGLYPRDVLDGLFDAVVISGEVGMRKPDPEIFALVTRELGVAASGCVFVDDHSGHLKAAQEVGMTTVLHRSPAETISELEELLGVELH
jgi:epoxide hydrolase-like predicted phosphatase